MERRFDATLKSLLDDAPEDWLHLLGISGTASIIDAETSTVTGAADKVLRLEGAVPSILHLDFQSGPDASKPCDLNVYNSVLEKRHNLSVRSILVLLSPRAELRSVQGIYERGFPGSPPYRIFRYEIMRIWQMPPASFLAGGLGTLPLAPIGAVTPAELPNVLQEMRQRLEPVKDRSRVGKIWTAVFVLMGFRYEQSLVEQLLQGVMGMEESVTYQSIIAKGEAKGEANGARKELRKIILNLGTEQFGEPAPSWAVEALSAIEGLEELESLATKILRVESWPELIPRPRKSSRRKKDKS